jgi:CheY-like chemotaxis protein
MAKKVLAIDDDSNALNTIKNSLEQGGFEVHTCDTGRRALDEIRRLKPNLVILDILLPGIDGFTLQSKISQQPETMDIPIIVLTGLEQAKPLFDNVPQVVGFMTKPFRGEELVELAHKAVASPVS